MKQLQILDTALENLKEIKKIMWEESGESMGQIVLRLSKLELVRLRAISDHKEREYKIIKTDGERRLV